MKIDSPNPEIQVGEILVKGENVMSGYYKSKTITAETIDSDGWLHTGDLGTMDEEGFLFIKGRSKSMILGASGQNIYPEEIESFINNWPYVQESLVVERKESLVALIYPDMELVDKEKIGETKLNEIYEVQRKQLNKVLPAYMQVSKIQIYPNEFEKTPKRSIKRFLYS
jgi:long-chain acyl-CoA synthetase